MIGKSELSKIAKRVERNLEQPDPAAVLGIDCVVGTYVNVTGSDSVFDCIDCAIGKYADEEASPICKDCAPGYYTPLPHLESCIACLAGQFQAVEGRSGCAH